MSAFIVSNRTITRVIAAIKHVDDRDLYYINDKDLGDRLLAMNADAVSQRYNEPVADVEYVPEPGLAFSRIDALKALSCYLYQCFEGNVPESQFYQQLDSAEKRLCSRIISSLPEYDAAPWDSRDDEPALIEL